jgi:hypothetical protein
VVVNPGEVTLSILKMVSLSADFKNICEEMESLVIFVEQKGIHYICKQASMAKILLKKL